MLRPPPLFTLFPYTTLFRSVRSFLKAGGVCIHARLTALRRDRAAAEQRRDEGAAIRYVVFGDGRQDRKSTRLNSSHTVISYAVFCLKKKKIMITCDVIHRGK